MCRSMMAALTALSLIAVACTEDAEPEPTPSPISRGGTLRVGSALAEGGDFANPLRQPTALDPRMSFLDALELLRCCLARTLLSYPGKPTREGGATLQPDLAASMPEISGDGLTWTFRLKAGLRYGPPLADIPIRAQDFIRAMERLAGQGFFSYLYSGIEGFDAFVSGEADSIAGLEAPDDRTLRVHLVSPSGDLGDRFSLPATAPIPPDPDDPDARFGAATGHDDGYGGFLVSTGPYMLEGSGAVDFTLPPREQRPASGFRPGRSITLVRNPSWDPATDALRGAHVNRIEISFVGSKREAARALDDGRIDLVFLNERPPQAPLSQVAEYRTDPLKGFVSVEPADTLQFISMNLAVPPLDDIRVRKAINLAVDKAAIQEALGGPDVGQIIGHMALNSLENDLLLDYDPYGAMGQAGNVKAAREEMSGSRYDEDGDGLCDASVCDGLPAFAHDDPVYGEAVAEQIASDLRRIGIDLNVKLVDLGTLFTKWGDPTRRAPLTLTVGWQKDILNASTWFESLFSSRGVEQGSNHPLLGATPQQLRQWGYSVTEVPSVDARIDACIGQAGEAQLRCWVSLDQHLMENVVPWVPYVAFNMVNVVPDRIVRFSYDQFGTLPALDQIAVAPRS